MGLIIKDKLQKMIIGYPTVSDKYNVTGGIFEGSTAIGFGDLVKIGSAAGCFTNATSLTGVADIGGIALATNVKLNETWPSGGIKINKGEAFNLLINGFVAVALDSGATASYIAANKKVCVILATGKLTTADKYNSGTIEYLPDTVFTGMTETQGTTKVAEIYVK